MICHRYIGGGVVQAQYENDDQRVSAEDRSNLFVELALNLFVVVEGR